MDIPPKTDDYFLFPEPLSMAVSAGADRSIGQHISFSEAAAMLSQTAPRTLEEGLFDIRAELKIITSKFGASHIDPVLRSQLFVQIDWLLRSEEWEQGDNLPNVESFKTLIRFILNSSASSSPSLGLSDAGNLLASWINGTNKLVLECFSNGGFKWLVSCVFDGKMERAAGEAPSLVRMLDLLEPYKNAGWFIPEWRK